MATYINGAAMAPFPQASGIINGIIGGVVAEMPVVAAELVIVPGLAGAVTAPFPQVNSIFWFGLRGDVIAPLAEPDGVVAGSIPILSGVVSAQYPWVFAVLSSSVVGVSGGAIVVNLGNKALSMYEDFPYDSFATFGGNALAIGANGIVLFGGDTDEASPISSRLAMSEVEFSEPGHKRITDVYVDLRGDGELSMTTVADEVNSSTYHVPIPPVDTIETVRVKHGRGTKGRHWQTTIRNVDGADFEIQAVEMMVDILSRRI